MSSTNGILSQLNLTGVGPAKNIQLDFASRANLLTGDNGLGKSFILETAWWALSGHWTNFPAYPQEGVAADTPLLILKSQTIVVTNVTSMQNIIGLHKNGF